MTRMLTIIAVLPVLLVSGCGPSAPVRIAESDVVTFVKLDRPIKFGNEVYTTEQRFRLIDFNGSNKGVIFGLQSNPFWGAETVQMGVTVDNKLCFNHKLLIVEFGWRIQDLLPPMTQNFCFKVERKVDLR